jgi:Bacteriocin-protection, YdeI or OmpD-Associated
MNITQTIEVKDRRDWRLWLSNNHLVAKEIWLIRHKEGVFSYLDSVEEALCFGWIDGIAKTTESQVLAQRFTPRRPNSNWTELNKARAQRLIKLGLMTASAIEKLPPLEINNFVPEDILLALSVESNALQNFNNFPLLYRSIRIGYIVEMRKKPIEYNRRLTNFVTKTGLNVMYGNWNDGGRLE